MKENFVENTKRISRYFDRSSIVDRIEIRLDFALPCTIAADYTILKQLIAGELQKQAEEFFTAAIALVKQLQEAANKMAEEAALPEDLQEEQEDDISNSNDKESLDKDTWGLTQWPIEL